MKSNPVCCLLTAALLPLSTFWLPAADPIAPSDQPTTAVQAAQMESVKRQNLAVSASQAIADGHRLLLSAKYDEAAARFQYAFDALAPGGGTSENLFSRATAGLAAAKMGQAQEAAKDTKFAQAAQLLQQSINLEPNDPAYPKALEDLKQQQMAYEQQIHDPEGTVNNPAVTDEFKDKVATVQKLLFQGDSYFRTGQYAKSEETYSKILILDPYNKAARDKMDHIEKYRERADEFRHEEYEQATFVKLNQGWEQAVSPDIVTPQSNAVAVAVASNRANITHKLQSIIIDKVNFDKLDINTVVQFLQEKSKELDPDHQGINFVLRLSSNTSAAAPDAGAAPPTGAAAPPVDTTSQTIHREVSITLDHVPLSILLNYIAEQTNLQYSVEDYAVYLRPSIDEGETLTVRTYLVPPNFFTGAGLRIQVTAPTDNQPTTIQSLSVNAQPELESKGIHFPSGATAVFLPGSGKLVVRNTPEQLDLLENVIENASKETPQVQIETKLAEFNQDAIKALSFNWAFGFDAINGNLNSATNVGGQTALRTTAYVGTSPNGGLNPNSIDQLIQSNQEGTSIPVYPITNVEVNPNVPNVIQVGAIINNTGLAMIINMINNLQGASLLSAPSVTTQNGLKASIDIVREFPYPTSFDQPKLSTTTVAYTSGPFGPTTTITPLAIIISPAAPLQLALPPTPREFQTENIGVSLEVKPTTYPDKRIDLDITKCQVIDFDGFINYGVPITSLGSNLQTSPTILTAGIINQPVFNLRSVVTNLQILDGQTAVLGGLTREDTQEVNDKVPVLGDLPLVGRLFQSKVSERTKKSLVIFVTARLVKANGKPQYSEVLEAEPEEEPLPEPSEHIDAGGSGVTLPPLPEGTPNS